MAKLKVIKKTEEVETSNMDDKKPGVTRKTYIPNPNIYNPKLESTTNIDTAGYAAGAKKFPKVKILEATGKTKQGMAKRKEVDKVIKNPVEVNLGYQGVGLSANEAKRAREIVKNSIKQ